MVKNKKKASKKVKKKIKRKISKLTVPEGFGNKDDLVAFRCQSELKQFLDNLNVKSEFIIKALYKAREDGLWVTCPNCQGKGFVKV